MRKFGLVGRSLGHSFSQGYFESLFKRLGLRDCCYKCFELDDIHRLKGIVNGDSKILGLNVTVPHKESVVALVDKLSIDARQIGAVNVIKVVRRAGRILLFGFNTDAEGFIKSLAEVFCPSDKIALVLGTGGAAKAVAFALKSMRIKCLFVSRNPMRGQVGYGQLRRNIFDDCELVVNATPVGTFPRVDFPNIPYRFLDSRHFLYDLVYNPEQTEFLRRGAKHGARTMNGMKMLEIQAEASWRIWNDQTKM